MWLLLAALSAEASPYAFRVVGRVDDIYDTTALLAGQIAVGEPVVFTYAYDTVTSDLDAAFDAALYRFAPPDFRVEVDIGGSSLETADSGSFQVALRTGAFASWQVYDALPTIARGPLTIGRPMALFLMQDPSGQALRSLALPATPPSLVVWPTVYDLQFSTFGTGGREWLISSAARDIRRVPYLRAHDAAPQTDLFASGLTPRRSVLALTSPDRGVTAVPSGPCQGAYVPLQAPVVRATLTADATGQIALQPVIPPALQGQRLVLFDLASCTASTTAILP